MCPTPCIKSLHPCQSIAISCKKNYSTALVKMQKLKLKMYFLQFWIRSRKFSLVSMLVTYLKWHSGHLSSKILILPFCAVPMIIGIHVNSIRAFMKFLLLWGVHLDENGFCLVKDRSCGHSRLRTIYVFTLHVHVHIRELFTRLKC